MLLLFQYRGLFENPQMFFNGLMTLTVRNGLLSFALFVLALLVVGYAVLLFVLVSREGWIASVGRENLIQLVFETMIAPMGSAAAYWLTRRAYRKSGSPEAFFFALFAVSLGGESLQLVQAWLQTDSQSDYFTALLTRTVWAFRFTGLFFLFCASLFTFDFSFRKFGSLVGISAVSGILVASWLPLQSASHSHTLLVLSDSSSVLLVTAVLSLVIILNFTLGAIRAPSPERTAHAGAVVCFLAAWALVCLWNPWGIVLAVVGALTAYWKAEQTMLVV
jgi:hypothetical protein